MGHHRSSLAAVTLLYAALTIVLAYPLSIRPADRVMSAAPDTNYTLWALSWDVHALSRQPLSVFDANIYHPERRTLAYSENLLGSAPLAAPILWMTGNPVLAMNLIVLTAAVLCGVGAYLLGRRLRMTAGAAVLCGAVFAFTPPRFLRLDQFHLATIEWIPFGLASLHAYLDEGRRRDIVLTAVFFMLQVLSSGHGAVFLLLAMTSVVACRIVLRGAGALPVKPGDLAVAAVCLVPAVAALWPYLLVQQEMGLKRSLEDWAIPWTGFLAPSTHVDTFLASLVPSWQLNDVVGPHLFPGLLPIALALPGIVGAGRAVGAERAGRIRQAGRAGRAGRAGLEILALLGMGVGVYVVASGATRITIAGVTVVTIRQTWRPWAFALLATGMRLAMTPRRLEVAERLKVLRVRIVRWRSAHRDDPRVTYAVVTAVSFWLAAGPPFGVWPLVYWLPGLNFIRAPSRFTLLTALGVAVLAGFGFERLASRLTTKGRAAAVAVTTALLTAEFAAVPFGLEPFRVEPPPIERWLAAQPMPFVVAEVPVGNPANYGQWEQREADYMLHSIAHWQKTVHGYSGFRSDVHGALFAELAEFPTEQVLQHLHELGVTDLVVHTDLYPAGDWPVIDRRIAAFGNWLTLRHVEGAGRVYALRHPH
jgi:hypothetical protein